MVPKYWRTSVAFFCERVPIVVFLIGTTAAERQASDGFAPKANQVVIEKFCSVVRVQFFHRKRQALQDAAEPAFHRLLPSPQDCHPLTPPRRHIDHLQGMGRDPIRTFSSMMDQIDLAHVPDRLSPTGCVS
jgi:hypothetical protein